MQELIPFEFEGRAIRVVRDKGGEPWWAAVDVCRVLGLVDTSVALRKLDEDEKTTLRLTPGHIEQGLSDNAPGTSLNLINEPGLYRLILTSRKAEAKTFKRWVTHEVLPAIRKTGKFETAASPDQQQVVDPLDQRFPIGYTMAKVFRKIDYLIARGQRYGISDPAQALEFAIQRFEQSANHQIRWLFEGLPLRPLSAASASSAQRTVKLDVIQAFEMNDASDVALLPSNLGALLGGYTLTQSNQILYDFGYQKPQRVQDWAEWFPTKKGAPFAVRKPVPRASGFRADGQILLWKEGILDALLAEPGLQEDLARVRLSINS